VNRRVFSTFLLVAACGASPGEEVAAQPTGRCAHCGMRITDWLTSTATRANGEHAEFDTPKCLFAFLASEEGAGARDLEVTEYYTRTRRAADAVVYVDGSDVTGPMGPDLIPIESRERAESFVHDHGGTILDLAGARARGPELFRY
jgi:nitrous oxide reductase accessory protein NosL